MSGRKTRITQTELNVCLKVFFDAISNPEFEEWTLGEDGKFFYKAHQNLMNRDSYKNQFERLCDVRADFDAAVKALPIDYKSMPYVSSFLMMLVHPQKTNTLRVERDKLLPVFHQILKFG